MFKIGNIKLTVPIMLAPMAGVSDLPFRLITRSLGCEFAFLEMISARALSYSGLLEQSELSTHYTRQYSAAKAARSAEAKLPRYRVKKTLRMMIPVDGDNPLGVQLLGADLQYIKKAMDVINKYNFEILDFNAGCPVNKAVKRGEGASLLKEPKKLKEILKFMVDNSKIPVGVKIRSGWSDDSINAVDVALHAQDAGIKYLFIHGRTKVQCYSGRVDYQIIRQVKEALSIPVIGSGDALSPELIKKMFDETGCDAVTIARGALGNPWIFRQTAEFLKTGAFLPPPKLDEVIATMLKHFSLCCDYHGERIGVIVFRKFFYWYTKKFSNIKILRNTVFSSKTKEQIIDAINQMASNKLELCRT
jgi:tRNA-dihydrouridine synthase B